MTATCSSLQKSVEWCEGTPFLAGLRKRLYYINKKLIVSWPTLSVNEIGQTDSAKYVGSFALSADAKWQYLDVIENNSSLTSESQGEYPSQTQLNKLNVALAGIDDDTTLLASVLNNSDSIFVIETAGGKYRVVGSEMYDVKVTVSQDLGQGGSGTASTTVAVEAPDKVPAPYYEGEIDAVDGGVDDDDDDDDDETVEYKESSCLITLSGSSDTYDADKETVATVAVYDAVSETIKF